MDLSESLTNWLEYDSALLEVGLALGFFGPRNHPQQHSHMFKTNNPLCTALTHILEQLVDIGVVERRDGPTDVEFCWSSKGATRAQDLEALWAKNTRT
ncbi:hypothetical protein [Embleya sp. NPDC020630]|uniref:hypothetical protein n=1 Tax=Embleya sp. NPDC020630 TaxID=3363979 RepID=UPI0037963109